MIDNESVTRSIGATLLVMGFSGLVYAAEPVRLEPLSDPEIAANSESGAACWAELKGKTYLYDDASNGFVKVNGKIIKLKRLAKGDSIGKGPYASRDGTLKIAILENGNLVIQENGQKTILKSKRDCGA
jgi:hypothetical protein